jgi:hypothetical protein
VFVAGVVADRVFEQPAGFHIAALLKGVDPLFSARLVGAQGKRQQEEGEEEQYLWGRLAACGGLATRQRRLPTGAQLDKLPHK